MGVTAAQISAALRSVGGLGGQGWSLDTLAKGANAAMAQAGINTREGAAVFMSQCMVESAYFRTTREYGGPSARYAPFYGRGFIQVTWRENYAKFGAWCKDRGLVPSASYFTDKPDRLADSQWAWLGAVWYLSTNGCIPRANRGQNADVGRIIHAGPGRKNYPINAQERNRQNHTMKAYNAMLRAGITAPSGTAATVAAPAPTFTKDDVKKVQRAVGVADDGVWGAGTDKNATAIRAVLKPGLKATEAQRAIYDKVKTTRPEGKRAAAEFRKGIQWALGVTADGVWGKNTEAAWQAIRRQYLTKPKSAAKSSPAKSSAKKKTTPSLTVDGKLGPATIKALQRTVGAKPADGKMGPATITAMQAWLKVSRDGIAGPNTVKALQKRVGAKPVDGVWGAGTTKALQTYLNKG